MPNPCTGADLEGCGGYRHATPFYTLNFNVSYNYQLHAASKYQLHYIIMLQRVYIGSYIFLFNHVQARRIFCHLYCIAIRNVRGQYRRK